MTRRFNKHAQADKAYQIYLRQQEYLISEDRIKNYSDPQKYSVGELRREKKACDQKIKKQQRIKDSINKALVKQGYAAEISAGGVS